MNYANYRLPSKSKEIVSQFKLLNQQIYQMKKMELSTSPFEMDLYVQAFYFKSKQLALTLPLF